MQIAYRNGWAVAFFGGLVELIVLEAGRSEGILDPVLYSVLLTMALATTLMTGPLLHRLQRPAVRRADTVHRHRLATEPATGEASR